MLLSIDCLASARVSCSSEGIKKAAYRPHNLDTSTELCCGTDSGSILGLVFGAALSLLSQGLRSSAEH